MSPRTLSRWQAWPAAANVLLAPFAWVSAADARTAEALTRLRDAPVASLGNLKLAAPAPGFDDAARSALRQQIGNRPVWTAASTHVGEDEIVCAAHDRVRAEFADALLIIVPRHPERGAAVAATARNAPRRSLGRPFADAPIYIADTLGELGLFYATSPIALVAGSLLPTLKGHNPIEPSKLGSAILSGPHVESFQDVFDGLFAAGGAQRVNDATDLAAAVVTLWRDQVRREKQIGAAQTFASQGAEAFAETLSRLASLLPAQSASHASA